MKNLQPDEFEVIGQKVSHRLGQRPGTTVVLKYVRPLIKILQSQAILCAPAPWASPFHQGSTRSIASSG